MINPFKYSPRENNFDISAITDGKLTKEVFKEAITFFVKKEMYVYSIYAQSKLRSDLFDWISNDPNIVSLKTQLEIWEQQKEKDNHVKMPPGYPSLIFYTSEKEYNGLYVFAVGVKDIDDYIDKDVIPFQDIEKEFGKENIMIMKI